jgi:hypothetical protein
VTYWKLERPSKRSGKKWQVRVPTSSGRGKTVAFGDAKMSDYTLHKDKARRDNYRTRHQHDRIDDPYAPGFWSWWSLWGESSDLDTAHAAAVKRAKKILGVKTEEGEEVVTREPRRNPTPTMAEVAEVVAVLDVPKHLRAEFMQGFATEWEHAHTVGYDLVMVGSIVLDHLAEDAHYYRKLRRLAGHRENPHAETSPSNRVQACFDALLSLVQEQYPSLSCTIEVDESAGERGGEACARAYAFCEDLDDGSFRIAVAGKMNDASTTDDSRVEGLLRHELAHAVLLHGGDLEHTERDADEVAEALFGSPLYYDEDDVQTTDPSALGARRPRPEYLDDEHGRTLDAVDPVPYADASRNPMNQLHTVEDVASCLDDCAAQGDAKTPRMLASVFSQQAKVAASYQAHMLTTLARAARHCANAIEARLEGNVEHAMSCERLCERALADAESPGRKNPRKQKFAPGFAPDFLERVSKSQESARRWEEEAPAREAAAAAEAEAEKTWDKLSPEQKRKYRSDPRIWEHPFGAAGVAHDDAMGRKNPHDLRTPVEKAFGLQAGEAYGAGEYEDTDLSHAKILGHKVEFSQNEATSRITGWVKGIGTVGGGYSLEEAKEAARKKLSALRNNPEWAKKLGSGLYKGARYSAETARDLYVGAREAHRARSAPPVEGERKNPRRAHHPRGHSRGHKG